jgi:hypothetical protein
MVQPVTPVGLERTRLAAFRLRIMTSRSPADVVAGTLAFGVVTFPTFTFAPTKLIARTATGLTVFVIGVDAWSLSVTVSVTS